MESPSWPLGHSETAQLIRNTDWSKTSLGPIKNWPAALRVTVQLCLDSKFPMYVWWGPEYINIYNDAYIALAGSKKHPHLFGKPAQQMWPEIWPTLQSFLDKVKVNGESVLYEDLHLPLERKDANPEEAYFTFSYGPARDENGVIQGVHCTCFETTSKLKAIKQTELAFKQLQSFFMQSPIPMVILLGEDHRFTIVNPPYERLINRKDITGKTVAEVFSHDDIEPYLDLLDKVYKTGTPFIGKEMLMPFPDAHGVYQDTWLDIGYHPYRDENGTICGILVVASDVSSQVRSKQIIEQSNEEFKLIANSMPQIVWNSDPLGELNYFNDIWFSYSGSTYEENKNNGWIKFVHPDDVPETIKKWDHALETIEPYNNEFRLLASNGMYRWHIARAYPVKNESGEVLRWIGTNTDIHDSKSLASEIEAEKIKFETLFADSASSMALLRGKDLIFEKVNTSYHQLFNNRVIIDMPILQNLPELIGQRFPKLLKDVYTTGIPYREEEDLAYLRRTEDGPLEERFFKQSYTQVRNSDGSPYGVFIHATDITDRVNARKEIEISEKRMNLALEAAQMGTWSIDLKTKIVTASDTFMKIVDIGHVGGDIYKEISRIMHPDDVDEVNQIWQNSVAEHVPYIHEYRIITGAGEVKWVHSRGQATYDKNGVPIILAGILMDITDKKLSEERLSKLALDLQTAVAIRDEFLSIASHELKTPLTSMKLQTQSIQRSILRGMTDAFSPEKVNRLVENTSTQVSRLNRLVDDMLDISKIQAGKMTLHREPVNLNEVLRHSYDQFKEQFANSKCGSSIEMQGEALGEFDRFKIEQVITNLLSNAIRYGARKPISLKLQVEGPKAIIKVIDQGIGIDPKNFDKVFDRFERIVDAKGINGLGLGLYITKQIVLAHHGEIYIESELGKGATFVVELPL